ncbi:hypothetical protein FSB78_07910 [Sphingomonas ginsenosidivorax]|uniref:PAS domain-containing protein n=1 Tax=Sphingomonas ginsenosidivorax TaxID=862135 RepID=A0A5C6UE27_9SPHN|nr:hypothetical protein [Sphingomonas ginsenosidivorax]TXC70874.1 hypothetical protein FSB78_07910 [Sphingomonas ginsenosidivorax]
MTMIGHSIGAESGLLLTMDSAVADFLQRSKAQLHGLTYTDITHPDDRHENVRGVGLLSVGSAPLRLRKRYILPGGGYVWASVQVSKLDTGLDKGCLVGTIFSLDLKDFRATPADLWSAAKRQAHLMAERNAVLGADLFNDGAWSVLLGLYIAEAEGRGLDGSGDCATACVSPVSRAKWLRALHSCALVEFAGRREDQPQLTQRGLERVEGLLTKTLVPAVLPDAPADI